MPTPNDTAVPQPTTDQMIRSAEVAVAMQQAMNAMLRPEATALLCKCLEIRRQAMTTATSDNVEADVVADSLKMLDQCIAGLRQRDMW